MHLLFAFTALALAQAPDPAGFPSAELSNGAITAKFHLPDPQKGYYRGTRFDWSGQIYSLRTKNHEYFGRWFPKYDPKLHDAIMGPVEEFRTTDGGLGYSDAKPGDPFIRVGVGVVKRIDEKPFNSFTTYDILDSGKWSVKKGRSQIRFTHQLKGPNSYAYQYTKTIRLAGKDPRMVIEHSLKNTGRKSIKISQYNHNFFVMDGQPSGPNTYVKFPFELKETRRFNREFAETNGTEVRYLKELQTGQSIIAELTGFGPTASDYDLRLENRKARAGVRIRGDRPLSKVVFWSIRTVFSPEPYIDIEVDPGKITRWTYTYDFYDLPMVN